ncbi:cytochrome P450 [Streptomyces sp. NPDC021212]|uniref:cytochrome P450 n=1 Tax=Streptomyces sp. NPDC021212 TaxID=3365118 RepID=UPI0037A1A374
MPHTFTAAAAPGALPVVGHGWALLRRPLDFTTSLASHGDLVTIRLGPLRAYVACHPELLWQVLTDDRTFDKGGWMYGKARALAGNGLPLCPHRDHLRQRRLMQPGFHRSRLEQYSEAMVDEITATTASWRDGQVIDGFPTLCDMALRTVSRTLFRTSADPDSVEEFRRSMAAAMGSFLPRLMVPRWLEKLPLPMIRRLQQVMQDLLRARDRLMAESAHDRGEDGGILSAMIAARKEKGDGRLSDADIDEQVLPLLIAGSDTVAASLAWALHLLAQHPDAERRVHEEVDRVLDGRSAQWSDAARLPYTSRVLTEALRLYPPAWLLTRVTTAPTRLGGHELRPGSTVVFSSAAVHRNPRFYADPDVFDPDRWLPHHVGRLPRGAYLPFGAGSRKCIGDRYGMVEATLALATITHRWQLRSAPGSDARPAPHSAILHPRRLLLRVRPRQGTEAVGDSHEL